MRSSSFLRWATLVFLTAAMAGWWSVPPQEMSDPATTGRVDLAVNVTGPAQSRETPAAAAIARRLERDLLAAIDPGLETYSGEELASRCRTFDYLREPSGTDPIFAYAERWARADPSGMLAWFQTHSPDFKLPAADGSGSFLFVISLFGPWSVSDPDKAISTAGSLPEGARRAALSGMIRALRKTDPARAADLAAQNVDLLAAHAGSSMFVPFRDAFDDNWTFLRGLPSGNSRSILMARYLDDAADVDGADIREIWNRIPDAERRELVAGGYTGRLRPGQGEEGALDGIADLWREQAEAGDPLAGLRYLSDGASQWAKADPAAAIGWALQHLKGAYRVTGTAQLFQVGAAHDFAATAAVWHALPEGTLRVRAAAELADGAPEERRADVEAVLSTLSARDLAEVNKARKNRSGH